MLHHQRTIRFKREQKRVDLIGQHPTNDVLTLTQPMFKSPKLQVCVMITVIVAILLCYPVNELPHAEVKPIVFTGNWETNTHCEL